MLDYTSFCCIGAPKVTSDALMAADRGMVTLLGSLDLSSAFDCVDHHISLYNASNARSESQVLLSRYPISRTDHNAFTTTVWTLGLSESRAEFPKVLSSDRYAEAGSD